MQLKKKNGIFGKCGTNLIINQKTKIKPPLENETRGIVKLRFEYADKMDGLETEAQ